MGEIEDYENRLRAQDKLIQLKQRQMERDQILAEIGLQTGQGNAAVAQNQLFLGQGLNEIEAARAFQAAGTQRGEVFSQAGIGNAANARGLAASGIREGASARQAGNTLQTLGAQNLSAQQQGSGLQREAATRQADILAQLASLEARRRALMTGPV